MVHPRSLVVLLALPLAAAAAKSAENGVDQWAVHAGAAWQSSWPARVDFGAGVQRDGELSLAPAAHAGLLLARTDGAARYELEFQAGSLRLDGLRLGTATGRPDARVRYQALTIGAYRTAALTQDLIGFAGLGIGFGRVHLPRMGLANCNCFAPVTRGSRVLQARVGIEWPLAGGHVPSLQVTWLQLPGGIADATPSASYPRRAVTALTLGYRRAF